MHRFAVTCTNGKFFNFCVSHPGRWIAFWANRMCSFQISHPFRRQTSTKCIFCKKKRVWSKKLKSSGGMSKKKITLMLPSQKIFLTIIISKFILINIFHIVPNKFFTKIETFRNLFWQTFFSQFFIISSRMNWFKN